MLLIVGTVPIKDLPLTIGEARVAGDLLVVNDYNISCTQGTASMISAAVKTTEYFNINKPQVLIAGDIGDGRGSREIYEYLIKNLKVISPSILTLHYCMPYIIMMTKLCEVVNELNKRPIMIADAGSMYAAKASGMAENFDVFTPDSTEMAFLADSNATHPAYIAKHFFDNDITQTPKLVKIAYKNKDIAKLLLVKGSTDYIVLDGNIIDVVNKPDIPAMEAIGGTGDTITGLISALIYSGLDLKKAALVAARSNRIAGEYAKANPATKISQIIDQFSSVFQKLKL